MKKIYLPHLNYTVNVDEFTKSPEVHKFLPKSSHAYTEKLNNKSCTIFIAKKAALSTIVHELVHALQFICEARGIDFVGEMEHMGYIAQYLTMEIMGGRWDNGLNKRKIK